MYLRRVARPLLAAAFVSDGWRALRHPQEEIAHLPRADDALEAAAARVPYLPANATVLVRGIGVVKIGAGALLGLGVAPRAAASVLAVLHLPTVVAANPFWTVRGQARKDAIAGFVRDAAVLGGLLLAAADTAGKPSLGWRLDAARHEAAEKAAKAAENASGAASSVVDRASRKATKAADRAARSARRAVKDVRESLPVLTS